MASPTPYSDLMRDDHHWLLFPVAMALKELGDIASCIIYGARYTDSWNLYRAELRIALAELLAECHILAERLGFNWNELEELGFQRLSEKSQEFRRKNA